MESQAYNIAFKVLKYLAPFGDNAGRYIYVDPNKSNKIKACNLGSKKKNKKLKQDKATIRSMIRKDLYTYITQPTLIVAEDLSCPIPGKKMAKSLNRKLNQWMKGELQDLLIAIGRKTGSTVGCYRKLRLYVAG